MGGCDRCCRCCRHSPPPKHRESPPRRRWGSGALAAVAGTPPRRRQGTGCPLPTRPPGPPQLRRRPGDRGFRLLLCRWGGNSLQPWSPGQADSHRGQHRLPPLAHPRGSPRRRRRGSRRGRPASRGSRSSHAGCSSPHINSYCSGGRAPSGSSSGSGNDGDPRPRIPHPAPRPATPHLPSRRGPGALRGPSPPGASRRMCPLGSRGPVPPSRRRCAGGTAGRSRSGAGGGAGAAGTERGPRGRGGGGRGRSQVAQPARHGQEIPERRSQSGPACPGTGHRAFGSRRRPVLDGQGSSRGAPGDSQPWRWREGAGRAVVTTQIPEGREVPNPMGTTVM